MTPPSDELASSRDYWDRHARRDPLWAILTASGKHDGQWDLPGFFEEGQKEITAVFYELDSQGITPGRGAALDFGCGVGRLTQALAPRFDRVVGVDISAEMQQLANALNRYPTSVTYVCNQSSTLAAFDAGAFDFIVSSIVLQHNTPEIALSYVREFCRLLAPGGVAVFQLPSHRRRFWVRAPVAAAMPDAAYAATLEISGIPTGPVAPGLEIMIDVAVTNCSSIEWAQRAFGVIRVGNHWVEATGRMVARDDGRTALPGTVRAGGTSRIPLTIKAPSEPGLYYCEVDLAHEGVLWFEDRGSPVGRFAVRVGAGGTTPDLTAIARDVVQPAPQPDAPATTAVMFDADVDDPGEFPMYGVSVQTVVETISGQHANLFYLESDRSCGDDWISYRYFVQRPR